MILVCRGTLRLKKDKFCQKQNTFEYDTPFYDIVSENKIAK